MESNNWRTNRWSDTLEYRIDARGNSRCPAAIAAKARWDSESMLADTEVRYFPDDMSTVGHVHLASRSTCMFEDKHRQLFDDEYEANLSLSNTWIYYWSPTATTNRCLRRDTRKDSSRSKAKQQMGRIQCLSRALELSNNNNNNRGINPRRTLRILPDSSFTNSGIDTNAEHLLFMTLAVSFMSISISRLWFLVNCNSLMQKASYSCMYETRIP